MGQDKYKIVKLNSNRSVITFNVNELNVPIRRQRLSDWVTKNLTGLSLQETYLKYKDIIRLEVK